MKSSSERGTINHVSVIGTIQALPDAKPVLFRANVAGAQTRSEHSELHVVTNEAHAAIAHRDVSPARMPAADGHRNTVVPAHRHALGKECVGSNVGFNFSSFGNIVVAWLTVVGR